MKKIVFLLIVCSPLLSFSQNIYPSSGNVGFGTTSPEYKLDIINESTPVKLFRLRVTGAPTDYFRIANATSASGQFIPALWGYHDSDNRQAMYIVGTVGTSNDTGTEPIMSFDSQLNGTPVNNRPLFGWDNYGNRRMTLTASGNLGIGTATPAGKLEIETGYWMESLLTLRDTHYSNQVFKFQIESDGLKIKQDNNINYQFKSGGDFIVNNGSVGIGTYSPDSKLTVNGTIHSKEVKVDLSVPGPDYVFEDNYSLQSLEEIDTYIKQNKHLPEVPSAAEMEKEGIKVGEMNMLLLKKMEEMTLYMIEQKEQSDRQLQMIESLKQEIQELKSGNN